MKLRISKTMQERFTVEYHIIGDEAHALAQAKNICLEQTVEVSDELVPSGFIRDHIIGQIENFVPLHPQLFAATLSYAVDTTALELTQLLNVIFGNTSIKAGIQVHHVNLSPTLLNTFRGPRFGVTGWRNLLKVFEKPLLCTALKPMGKSPEQIAELAYAFALGGVDVIKDDHGLTNQAFCQFEQRVKHCVRAVQRANDKTGKNCVYAPNVTAPSTELMARVTYAKQTGAGALLMAPGLTGFDTMRALAADDRVNLPLISHPALLGSMVLSLHNGFAHRVMFGQLQRVAGADASIYPNYGGRFGFSQAECQRIAQGCDEPMGHYPSIFPTPGGGMNLTRIPEMLQVYGEDVMFLIGGALYSRSPDLVENAQYFLSLVGR
jgi:ribulose-bisphosphate carboxylase large chain